MTQLSMEEILADESAPAAEVAKEQMTPDEREALEERRAQEQQTETGEKEETAPPAESEPARTEQEPEDDSGDDLPEFLKSKPEDAQNWRSLRGIAKDAQKAAKEAADARQALEVEKARLEAQLAAAQSLAAQQQRAPAAPAPQMPDPETDPGGYARAVVQQETERLRDQQLNVFEANAVRAHGKDAVEQAFAWALQRAQSDPAFAAQMNQVTLSADPWDWSVREHKREQAVAQMGDDPLAYIEAQKAAAVEAALAKVQQDQGQATSAQVEAEIAKRLPKSLAKAPGVGGVQAEAFTGPTSMDAILKRE